MGAWQVSSVLGRNGKTILIVCPLRVPSFESGHECFVFSDPSSVS